MVRRKSFTGQEKVLGTERYFSSRVFLLPSFCLVAFVVYTIYALRNTAHLSNLLLSEYLLCWAALILVVLVARVIYNTGKVTTTQFRRVIEYGFLAKDQKKDAMSHLNMNIEYRRRFFRIPVGVVRVEWFIGGYFNSPYNLLGEEESGELSGTN
jgi:hypothetical protein